MQARHITIIGALALVLGAGACNRSAKETRNETIKEDAKVVDSEKDAVQKRNDEIARLNDRVAKVEQEYSEKAAKVASGRRTATAGLKEEVQEDVTNVKQA